MNAGKCPSAASMLQSAFEISSFTERKLSLLNSRFSCFCVLFLLLFAGVSAFGQTPSPTPNRSESAPNRPEPTPKKSEAKEEKKPSKNLKDALKNLTVDQVVELAILVYANPGGREKMKQIRKTEVERGKLTTTNAAGQTINANYLRWVQRGEPGKDKFRLDQEQPTATFALVQNDDKVFGIYNESVFQPREDAIATFQDRLLHSIDSLLWYKENGSKIELAGREKILGVDFYLIDLTDSKDRKTRYYVSAKTFRVMMLDYETGGVKHTRKFRDYKYAQGVLVPFHSELMVDDKVIEEIRVGTVTFGQKLDETLFSSAS